MNEQRNKSTATANNALAPDELEAFLSAARVTRLATPRQDGFPHVAPAWFLWEDGRFYHSIGSGRMHLKNLARQPIATECVDVDERPSVGLSGQVTAVVAFGDVEVLDDSTEIMHWTGRILQRYLTGEELSQYLHLSELEIPAGRRVIRVTPRRILSWDYSIER